MLCPMVTRSRQLRPHHEAFWELLPKCSRTRRPSMVLVCHANCQTSRTGVSRWFYKFSSEGLAMWPAGHTLKPRLGCFRSRGCVSIKTQSASGFGLRETAPQAFADGNRRRPHRRATSVGPRSRAERAERSVSGTVMPWIAVGLCRRRAEGSTGNDVRDLPRKAAD